MVANILVSLFLVSSCFLFLFASQCSSFSIDALTPEAEIEAKAAAIQYWNLRVPYNKPLPSILLSKLQTATCGYHPVTCAMTRAADNAAMLGFSNRMLLQPLIWDDHPPEPPSESSQSSIIYIARKDQNNSPQELDRFRPLFFRERDLKEDIVTHIYDFSVEASPLLPFLPGSTAHKIPFTAAAVKGIFHLSEDSEMGKDVERAVSECHHAPALGETRRCVVTVEDMIDYVISTMGTNNVDANSTLNSNGFGRDILIGEINLVNDPAARKLMRIVTCHQVNFPFLLHYCHSLRLNRVYEVQLLDVETKKEINRAMASCHLDTSEWDTEQRGLKVLGGKPGEIEVCHWLGPFDIIWTAT